MKKLTTTLALAAAITTAANADFTRIEMGVGGWDENPKGYITYTDTNSGAYGRYDSDEKSHTSTYAWLLVKHPIPIIPNIRLEYVKIDDNGKVSGQFEDFTTGGLQDASFTMNQYDIIPYYNILDNTLWTTIDLGVDVKVLDTTFEAKGVTINNLGTIGDYSDKKTVAVPMGYVRARVQIPATGLGVEGDVKYITYSGSTFSDVRIKADYTFDITPVIQPGIEVGYRRQKLDLESSDNKTKVNMTFDGVYAGVMLRF